MRVRSLGITSLVFSYAVTMLLGAVTYSAYAEEGETSSTANPSRTPASTGNELKPAWPGRGAYNLDGRIVGGNPAPTGAYPWIVSLGFTGTTVLKGHRCGGSLVTSDAVVTAAHCVDHYTPKDLQVVAHTHVLSDGGVIRSIDRIVLAKDWSRLTFVNDLAVLRLSTPFTKEEAVPIDVVPAGNSGKLIDTGSLAVVAGWGGIRDGGAVSDTLNYVGVRIVSHEECSKPEYYRGRVTETMVCAGIQTGGADACEGDSGGPLMVFNPHGGYLLGGVVSWGNGCGAAGNYGVYTRVSGYEEWLQQALK